MRIPRNILMALLGLVACGRVPTLSPSSNVDAGVPGYFLDRIGEGELEAQPGDVVTLRAVLTNEKGAPVSGRSIEFESEELPGDVSLSTTSATTDSDGSLTNTVSIGSNSIGTLRLVAHAAGLSPVTERAVWVITITPEERQLRIIPNPPMVLVPDSTVPNAGNVTGMDGTTADLTVQVLSNSGPNRSLRPLSDEVVTFAFVTSIAGANFPDDVTRTVVTSSQGTASMTLALGATVGSYRVLASIAGGPTAVFTVTVTSAPPPCRYSSQCEDGESCIGGTCEPDVCDPQNPCPFGYYCESGQCVSL
jgi:hypothetical protein